MKDAYIYLLVGFTASSIGNAINDSLRTTIADLEKDPEKLEQFYQETKAAQIKAAAEKANAAAEKVKAATEELKRVQGPVKITSATRPSNFAQFKVRTMG